MNYTPTEADGVRRNTTTAPGALGLISMPFTFIQDGLLSTHDFINAAKDRGYRLSLNDLQAFHSNRLLVPLYRVSDAPVNERRIDVMPNGNMNDGKPCRQPRTVAFATRLTRAIPRLGRTAVRRTSKISGGGTVFSIHLGNCSIST